ncbi:MAG TPA: ATP synthase F1 subunit epsilon [Patescibacteria group bacterium]|nr:ATP synthase F1 subunit epsilon [Patescibacteria group bacterium]
MAKAAEKTLQLKLMTPDKTVLKQAVNSISVPTTLGQITILPEHSYIVSIIVPGELVVQVDGKESPLAVAGGIVEVFDNEVVVLADVAEHPEAIDVEVAEQRAKELAQQIAEETQMDMTTYSLLQRNLELERARIEVKKKWKR